MKSRVFQAVVCAFTLTVASQLHAQLFSPTDPILGGEIINDEFVVGVAGTAGGVNNWPPNESPDHAIDGVGQKYLNFGREDTGFIVTPASGSSVVESLKFWTANDAEGRDPASYVLYGTNADVSGAGPFALADFSLISGGDLSLPSSRNPGGDTMLMDANSQVVRFSNSDAYTSYLLAFPTVKDAGQNSMQIAEVQANIPEPTSVVLAVLLAGLTAFGWRRS